MTHNKTISAAGAAAALLLAAGPPAFASVDEGVSTAGVYFWADPETSVGDSTLRRTDHGVVASFAAGSIEPSSAITLWWVVFNQPEHCSAPGCGEDDIFVGGDLAADLNADGIAAADIVSGYAAGTLAAPDGTVYLSAALAEGDLGTDLILGEGALLKNAPGAEIHLVARSHGPAIGGLEDVQTTSFAGGCETMLLPPEVPDAEGECANLQYSLHPAVTP